MHILIVCVKLLKPAFPQFQLPLLSEHQCCGLQYQSEFKTRRKWFKTRPKCVQYLCHQSSNCSKWKDGKWHIYKGSKKAVQRCIGRLRCSINKGCHSIVWSPYPINCYPIQVRNVHMYIVTRNHAGCRLKIKVNSKRGQEDNVNTSSIGNQSSSNDQKLRMKNVLVYIGTR